MATLDELTRVIGRGRPSFGSKLKLGDTKCVILLLQSVMALELKFHFGECSVPSPVTKVARIQCLSCYHTLTSGQFSFSRLQDPDWSIQISGAPAVCKARD